MGKGTIGLLRLLERIDDTVIINIHRMPSSILSHSTEAQEKMRFATSRKPAIHILSL